MKLLCITSLLWLRNAVRAFTQRRPVFGCITTTVVGASVNLWRDYQYDSIRRTIDVTCAKLAYLFYLYDGMVRQRCTVGKVVALCSTNVCYVCSRYDILNKWRIFHPVFHLNVYNSQRLLLCDGTECN